MGALNPNIVLWKRYHDQSSARGKLIREILNWLKFTPQNVLDVGCGSGGIAIELAKHNIKIDAIDIDLASIKSLIHYSKCNKVAINCFAGSIENVKLNKYDFIVLSDTLEHVENPVSNMYKLYSHLNPGGYIYISTPNRYSPFNLLCDPHYSLPVVAMLNRKTIKHLLVNVLKWHNYKKRDFPQLFSYKKLVDLLLVDEIDWFFINEQVLHYALENPKSVWSRQSHIKTIKLLTVFPYIFNMINNSHGFFNKYINPTWFLLAHKNDKGKN